MEINGGNITFFFFIVLVFMHSQLINTKAPIQDDSSEYIQI